MSYTRHQYWPLTVVAPASTPKGSPTSTSWPLTWGHLVGIALDIPDGHGLLTGIRVTYQGTEVLPWSLNDWLVPVRHAYEFAWDDEVMPYGMVVQTFNTDVYPHTFYLRANIIPRIGAVPQPRTSPAGYTAPTAAARQAVAGLSYAPPPAPAKQPPVRPSAPHRRPRQPRRVT